MNAGWNLLKKELAFGIRLFAAPKIYVWIVLILGALSVYLAHRFQTGAVSHIWLAVIYLHALSPSIFMLLSLRKEREHSPLWLQLPLPGWKLLLAKYAAAAAAFVAGLLTSSTLLLLTYTLEYPNRAQYLAGSVEQPFIENEFRLFLGFLQGKQMTLIIEFVSVSIGLSVTLVLMYLIAAAFQHRIGRWSWPAAVAIITAVTTLEYLFEESSAYRFLFGWGDIDVSGTDAVFFAVGHYVWFWINLAICFYVSSWLLDRMVEV
ncbi:hypothetical protein [Paenibacillus xerothermodurans]|uniref:Uncharacterized protein n=1 Tax=Paenibacillus xerothermodurans TaxID=1977292 RepID=A0A2W1NBL0_PAEXE|nr:hypothetical protein [Paenibacillus xerothermodurans]PZE21314.1 hypothetical protein CBW46_008080 [Paenibacillus xerothermodurans]